jgi:hypothetical protein
VLLAFRLRLHSSSTATYPRSPNPYSHNAWTEIGGTSDLHEALKERTVYGISEFAVVFCGICLAFTVAASFDDIWKSMKWLQSLCNYLGGLLLTTFLITVFWELLGK